MFFIFNSPTSRQKQNHLIIRVFHSAGRFVVRGQFFLYFLLRLATSASTPPCNYYHPGIARYQVTPRFTNVAKHLVYEWIHQARIEPGTSRMKVLENSTIFTTVLPHWKLSQTRIQTTTKSIVYLTWLCERWITPQPTDHVTLSQHLGTVREPLYL